MADAILVPWFGCEFGAKAIADVLFGTVSPSRKLSISFPLNFDSFKQLNRDYQWVVEKGEFSIMIGSSCEDIRLTKRMKVEI